MRSTDSERADPGFGFIARNFERGAHTICLSATLRPIKTARTAVMFIYQATFFRAVRASDTKRARVKRLNVNLLKGENGF